jgi:hypothetical protein
MKHKNIILSSLALMIFSISAYSIDLNTTKNISDLNITDNNKTTTNDSDNFEKRIIYFDRSLSDDENFELIKKVIKDAKRLGFNALVVSQEYIYTRLSHQNPIMDKVKNYMSQIEIMAHENGLELIPMHFRVNVPNTVIQDNDENNRFYKDGKFSFAEASKTTTIYKVIGDTASVAAQPQVQTDSGLLNNLYPFENIKLSTEYKITIDATTSNYKGREIKVSVLDGDYAGENGKVIFGVHKYFKHITPTKEHGIYNIHFNSLNHKNQNGKIKVYVQSNDGVTIHSVTVTEVGYTKGIHVIRDENKITVTNIKGDLTYENEKDYTIDSKGLTLLSESIKLEKELAVTWYPKIATSLPEEQVTFSDICSDEELYYEIMLDQLHEIKKNFNENIDSLAFDDDEWRAAGWNENCQKLYEKEFKELGDTEEFTGGDYIGISTKRMVDTFLKDLNKTDAKIYLMSDMFDPNFNEKDPYMGVYKSATGADKYLPKDNVVMFNWFPNPYEPGLEDKKEVDFLKSAKHFADLGLKQVIAGYHDDMRNLDSNFAFYNKSDKKTQESIIGFMYLIWFQPDKPATYDDMDDVVKRICTELPGKWPSNVCKEVAK